MGGRKTELAPSSSGGAIKDPPPTRTTGIGSADVFILSITASSIFLSSEENFCLTSFENFPFTLLKSPTPNNSLSLIESSSIPIAQVTSVAVTVFPPNTRPSVKIFAPVDSGPIVTSLPILTTDPPPRPMDSTWGMEKFVLTPAIKEYAEDCRGNPDGSSKPTSVVVPPISATITGFP
ncbi:hypothetical protein OGAPHI_001338 [Ogataea philodendri]|uniref:Uncharacterized protein n=1 Tax=Ogataea philodendri TaxID=1378263 RepID=A0A9P8PC90_9ASCO|nr:uncharacterized protein OGAPHI_001338 [Ogataea philodendri]KAH3669217.1 hypothetical protein OGAPHI_001338 [Ogataea philodendri]